MTDESGVTNLEAGMLAENLREQNEKGSGQTAPVQDAPKQAPAAVKKPATQAPDAKSKKPTASAAPESPQEAVAEPAAARGDQGEKLKAIATYIQYALIGLLVIIQILSMSKLSSTNEKLAQLEKTLSDMKVETQKRESEQEKKFSEAIQEKEKQDDESRKKSIATETLNHLRDGLPERRLIRRKGGDWYVMGKKEEAIGNPEVIEVLNTAFSRARAAERTSSQVVPPHTGNAICVLKPDGLGGTQVTTAYDFIVSGK